MSKNTNGLKTKLGLDAASTQAERRVDAECLLANAVGPHRQASSERISVEQDRHRAAADIDPPDETEQAGCRGTIIIITITITTGGHSPSVLPQSSEPPRVFRRLF